MVPPLPPLPPPPLEREPTPPPAYALLLALLLDVSPGEPSAPVCSHGFQSITTSATIPSTTQNPPPDEPEEEAEVDVGLGADLAAAGPGADADADFPAAAGAGVGFRADEGREVGDWGRAGRRGAPSARLRSSV
ncbi:hypothetical protein GZL_08523 [Streptomyces sp. 769]|nr:hypothetical protein GZL_08523 [Streptomyces sp. 769]